MSLVFKNSFLDHLDTTKSNTQHEKLFVLIFSFLLKLEIKLAYLGERIIGLQKFYFCIDLDNM